jgi:hypothetical protein
MEESTYEKNAEQNQRQHKYDDKYRETMNTKVTKKRRRFRIRRGERIYKDKYHTEHITNITHKYHMLTAA